MSGSVEGMAEEALADLATSSASGFRAEDAFKLDFNERQTTLLIAGMATLLAANMCLNLVQEHVRHWKRSREQRAIIAIIFMVPLFAVDSYFGELEGSSRAHHSGAQDRELPGAVMYLSAQNSS